MWYFLTCSFVADETKKKKEQNMIQNKTQYGFTMKCRRKMEIKVHACMEFQRLTFF